MAEQRNDLADVVRDRRAALNLSLRELEARSVDPETGEPARFGWVSKLEKGRSTGAPTPAMLRALAVGLQLPLRVLQEAAAAQYLGMISQVWSDDGTARLLVARIEEMTPEERQQLADIAETFARRRGGAGK